MEAVIIPILLGILISVLGIVNMTGNISSIHSYHRHRVSEENRLPFGRLVGSGTLTIGISVILFACGLLLTEIRNAELYTIIGTAVLLVGIVVGMALSFYAMKKYNKGIF